MGAAGACGGEEKTEVPVIPTDTSPDDGSINR